MSGSNTICNDPNPPLADIVLFSLSLLGFPSRLSNSSARKRFPHPYKECFVLLPNQGGTSQRIRPKRTIFISGGLGPLQIVSDLNTGQCASEDVGLLVSKHSL